MPKTKEITKFKGYSGCDLRLLNDGQRYFVRKMSPGSYYNPRLKKQAEILRSLKEYNNKFFRIPEIYGESDMGGRYFYDMEFVPNAQNAFFYLENCSPKDAIEFSGKVFNILKIFSSRQFMKKESFFEENFKKIERLEGKLKKIPGLSNLLGEIKSKKKKLAELEGLKATLSHGDITLDNILVDNLGQLWLIDALDNPYPHYFYDIAKIYQDLEGHWSYLHNNVRFNSSSNVALCREVLSEKIKKNFREYLPFHYYFLGMAFLRILPYLKNGELSNQINQRSQEYISKFLKGEKLI